MGAGDDVSSLERLAVIKANAEVAGVVAAANSFKFIQESFQVMSPGVFDDNVTFGSNGGTGVRYGFVTIGHDAINRGLEFRDADDGDSPVPGSFDLGAHLVKKGNQVVDLRLQGGIMNHGFACGQNGGHDQGFGAGMTGFGESVGSTSKLRAADFAHAALEFNHRAQSLQAGKVTIQGTIAQFIAAG